MVWCWAHHYHSIPFLCKGQAGYTDIYSRFSFLSWGLRSFESVCRSRFEVSHLLSKSMQQIIASKLWFGISVTVSICHGYIYTCLHFFICRKYNIGSCNFCFKTRDHCQLQEFHDPAPHSTLKTAKEIRSFLPPNHPIFKGDTILAGLWPVPKLGPIHWNPVVCWWNPLERP